MEDKSLFYEDFQEQNFIYQKYKNNGWIDESKKYVFFEHEGDHAFLGLLDSLENFDNVKVSFSKRSYNRIRCLDIFNGKIKGEIDEARNALKFLKSIYYSKGYIHTQRFLNEKGVFDFKEKKVV